MISAIVLSWGLAQEPSRIVCERNAAGQTVCRTSGAAIVRGRCAAGDWLLAGCTYGEHQQARRERDAAEAAGHARQRAGQLVAAGDCDLAVDVALAAGDFALAREVRDFCAD